MQDTAKMAIDKKLTRRVLQLAEDGKVLRVQVSVSDKDREELDYYFIDGGVGNYGQAIQTAKHLATLAFLNIALQIKEAPAAEVAEEVVEEPVEETPPKTVKKKASKKVTKKTSKKSSPTAKAVVYDRTNKAHKKEFGEILNKIVPEWGAKAKEDDDLKAAIGKLSQDLNGQPFIGGDKEVLPEFIEAIVDVMAPFGNQGEDSDLL